MQEDDADARCAEAWEIWLRCVPINGTLAERYLRETLGLTAPFPEVLSFHPAAWCNVYGDHCPALCAPIFGAAGQPTAILQTFLCADTIDSWKSLTGDPVTELVGEPYRGAVWTGCPDSALGLAVTLEEAVAATARYSLPVWAVGRRDRMRQVRIPPQVQTLLIFEPGADAPYSLGRRPARRAAA